MARTTFGDGTIVTTQFLNGAQKLYFDGLDQDWHYDPLDVEDMDTSDIGTGLGTKFVTLDTRQTLVEPKVFHNNPASSPGPLPGGTTADQYRFTDKVIGIDPTAQKHLTTKDYVDRQIEALNLPTVNYGSGNSNQVVVQQIKSSIDLTDLQPRFKGQLIGFRHWHYQYWTQWGDGSVKVPVITPDNITANANWMSMRVITHPGNRNNQEILSQFYLVGANGTPIPLAGSATWNASVLHTDQYAPNQVGICSWDNIFVPIPKGGWSSVYADMIFKQLRCFSLPPTWCVGFWFWDFKDPQKYFIIPDPADASNVVVIGPDKMKVPSLVGAGLGISQSVSNGLLKATVTYSVDNTYLAGNPSYTGSTTVPLNDIDVIWEFKSRVGDVGNPGDPINDNASPGQVLGAGINDGNTVTATSDPIPAGEYCTVSLTTTSDGRDPSDTVSINFQADSPPITNVPSNFTMTSPTDTSLNITWDAVAGVKYVVNVEEQGDGQNGQDGLRYAWSDFPPEANAIDHNYYVEPMAGVTGSAGNITISPVLSGTTYRATIRAAAPNALISPTIQGTPPTISFVPGSYAQITTTGSLSEVAFSVAVLGTSKADLTSKVPSDGIPAGAIGIVTSGPDKGIYIYDANATPDVWVILAS
ncbi:MAG: hypothetical protein R3321_02010 [Nitrososphaeraceae archaeon]|nr:hypothetical protein [Nitrososphaeraceae archaeon]